MENSEHQLAVITTVMAGEIYNLYITDKRFVMVNKASSSHSTKKSAGTVAALALGGIIGGGLAVKVASVLDNERQKKKVSKELEDNELGVISLDELLKNDEENNFEILYSQLNWVKVFKSRWGSSLAINAVNEDGAFELSKEQAEQLSQLLPTIEALKGKLK